MQILGHRGIPSLAPENTFASFDLALRFGADGLETDIHRTADGKLILIHNEFIDKTTNGVGRVDHMRWEELKQLDAGAWFDKKFAGARIPLLEEFLKRYGSKTFLDLEIKPLSIELEVLEMAKKYVPLSQMIFTSFDLATVHNLKKKNAKAKVGYLVEEASSVNIDLVQRSRIDWLCPQDDLLTKELVDTCHKKKIKVLAYSPLKKQTDPVFPLARAYDADGVIVNNLQRLRDLN